MSLPDNRPPTKAECWTHWKEYFGPDKDFDWLVAFARKWWTQSYVTAVCLAGWAKQPDWTEGDPVIPAATGTPEMFAETRGKWGAQVEALYRKAQERAA